MQFLSNINFNKNDLQNVKIQNLSSPPSNPEPGQIYFNTITNILYYWNGTSWIDFTTPSEPTDPEDPEDPTQPTIGLTAEFTGLTCTLPNISV